MKDNKIEAQKTITNNKISNQAPLVTGIDFKMIMDNSNKEEFLTFCNHTNYTNFNDKNNISVLHVASYFGLKGLVETLIQHGACANAKNDFGNTPLHYATKIGHVEIVNLLIIHGADVNIKNNLGGTPLHLAAENGKTEILKILVKSEADLTLKTNIGYRALDLAICNEHMGAFKVLLKTEAPLTLNKASLFVINNNQLIKNIYFKAQLAAQLNDEIGYMVNHCDPADNNDINSELAGDVPLIYMSSKL